MIYSRWQADRSGKPGEGLCDSLVPDLQRIAATEANECAIWRLPAKKIKNAVSETIIPYE